MQMLQAKIFRFSKFWLPVQPKQRQNMQQRANTPFHHLNSNSSVWLIQDVCVFLFVQRSISLQEYTPFFKNL